MESTALVATRALFRYNYNLPSLSIFKRLMTFEEASIYKHHAGGDVAVSSQALTTLRGIGWIPTAPAPPPEAKGLRRDDGWILPDMDPFREERMLRSALETSMSVLGESLNLHDLPTHPCGCSIPPPKGERVGYEYTLLETIKTEPVLMRCHILICGPPQPSKAALYHLRISAILSGILLAENFLIPPIHGVD
jgi:hypothetical protein